MIEEVKIVARGNGWAIEEGLGCLRLVIRGQNFQASPKHVSVTLPQNFVQEFLKQKKQIRKGMDEVLEKRADRRAEALETLHEDGVKGACAPAPLPVSSSEEVLPVEEAIKRLDERHEALKPPFKELMIDTWMPCYTHMGNDEILFDEATQVEQWVIGGDAYVYRRLGEKTVFFRRGDHVSAVRVETLADLVEAIQDYLDTWDPIDSPDLHPVIKDLMQQKKCSYCGGKGQTDGSKETYATHGVTAGMGGTCHVCGGTGRVTK